MDIKRNCWVVLVVAGILAIAVTLIQQTWLPYYDLVAFLISLVILGIAFYLVYTIDREALWWALIPALAMLVLLATSIVAYLTPKDVQWKFSLWGNHHGDRRSDHGMGIETPER